MPFEIFKNMKHIGINFTINASDLYNENYKTMLKEIKDSLKK